MSRITATSLAMAAACGYVGSQAFLSAPAAGNNAPSAALRGVAATEQSNSAAAQGSSSAFASAAGGFALVGLAAAAGTRPAKKTQRHFFGGSPEPAYRSFDPKTELGVQAPLDFWDPMDFCKDGDEKTFKRRRAVEIKHGRVSMYACIGYIVPEYFKFPGYLSPSEGIQFSDVPNGLAALSKLPVLGGAQILAFAGVIETTGFFQAASTTDGRGSRGEGTFLMSDSTEGGEPGNYGVGFPNFIGAPIQDKAERDMKLSAELANGRLAMVAIIGMFFQDGLTGSAWGDWALYTASPLR